MMTIRTLTDPAAVAGDTLTTRIHARGNNPTLLLLAGGSALAVLDHIDPQILGPHLTIMMMDDRFSIEPAVSNYLQFAMSSFGIQATQAGVTIVNGLPRSTNDPLETYAARLNTTLTELITEGVYTIALFGIGTDGHTAGIFPMNESDFAATYEVSDSMIVPIFDAPNEYRERISITPTFIRNHINESYVYAVGSEKQAVISRTNGHAPIHELPARIHADTNAILFTDLSFT